MRHREPTPVPDDPPNDVLTERLARRLADLCDAAGWKHDRPEANRSFRFWPWGSRRPPVTAALAIRTERREGETWKLAYVLLQLTRAGAPVAIVETRLPEMQKVCQHYGVSLTLGTLRPRTPQGGAMVAMDLSLPLLERALSPASLNEAILLLDGARLELIDLCTQ